MNECKKCGGVEPEDHELFWWRCECHKIESKSIDATLKEIEENFEELWAGVNNE